MSTTGVSEYTAADIAKFIQECGQIPFPALNQEVNQLIAYLNPKNVTVTQIPNSHFKISPLSNEVVPVLELFLKKTQRDTVKLKSDVDLDVDHILTILRAIAANPAIKIIDIDLAPNYFVKDMATLQKLLTLPEEKQRLAKVSSDEDEMDELAEAFQGFFNTAMASVNELKEGAMQSGRSLFTAFSTYVAAPAVEFLTEEARVPVEQARPKNHQRSNSANF